MEHRDAEIYTNLPGLAVILAARILGEFGDDPGGTPTRTDNQPQVALLEGTRSGPGTIRLASPRKTIGAAFSQDIEFSPPIGLDELVDVSLSGFLPEYNFAYLDDFLHASSTTSLGPTAFDFVARVVSFPTNLLVMRVFFPTSIGATPAGPRVGRPSSIDEVASSELVAAGPYSEWDGNAHGSPDNVMELRVPKPRFNRTYRVCWTLPPRP